MFEKNLKKDHLLSFNLETYLSTDIIVFLTFGWWTNEWNGWTEGPGHYACEF